MIKLLKTSFSILLIGFISILGSYSVNAGYSDIITKPNGQLIEQGQGGIKFQVSGNGSLLSQYLGLSRRVLAFEGGSPKVYFWRGLNGIPYAYYYYSNDNVNLQGYYNKYQVCDELTGGSVSVSNCVTYNVNTGSFYESLTPFFNSVKSSDYFGYSYGWYVVTIRTYYLRVCFSSHEFGQSVCFMTSDGLNNSLGLEQNISFGDLQQSIIGNPPGYSYTGGNSTGANTQNINNNYACPTIRQLMQNFGTNYNTGLCYNSTTYFNGNNFEQVDKQDIFTIFNDNYENYTNRISIYRNNCNTTSTQQNCKNAFSGEFKKYSIISNAINSNVDEKKIRNYCNFGLNYDPNTTTCVASGGGIKEPYTNEEIINEIVNDGAIPTPGTNGSGENNVLNTLTNCENGDRDCYLNNRNFIESLSNIYGKITGLFKERKNVEGIIPEYILRITFITILFTVIFKK